MALTTDLNSPCPDRHTDFLAWESWVYARALERAWREKANSTPSPAFGGTTPAPRPNLDEVA
jgi:hypothetical protein